uniref:NAD(P)H-quinone oxidoreductase subunit 3, chloroplastic n=1 Tax=Picocystis salinarum TaxID=88271 RepID=A0A088CIB8_9CHLO|nr:subunit 3 of NADH-plastoquinone oxidoreductase [Picocystis salinarum]AID67595.1 subunit 3 of NADH-plastoquinone oxidoreductase [Picocystis salinarum]
MFILEGYNGFLTLFFISLLIPILALTISKIIRPKSGGAIQRTTYESGIEPMGEAWIQFNIRYYIFALLFLLFDVETVFLYPWSVTFSEIGLQSFVEILIFIVILLIGLIYAWRKGALEWS